jgi:glucose uptake protein GlcU
MRQAVASTSQHNFILGTTATVLIVGGVALIAYSTTPSCKQNQPVNSRCDRDKVLGAIGIAGGTVMLVLWALSK